MGANLQYKGLKEVISGMNKKTASKDEGPSKEEVNKDWNRLASFMVGKK